MCGAPVATLTPTISTISAIASYGFDIYRPLINWSRLRSTKQGSPNCSYVAASSATSAIDPTFSTMKALRNPIIRLAHRVSNGREIRTVTAIGRRLSPIRTVLRSSETRCQWKPETRHPYQGNTAGDFHDFFEE